MDRAVANATGLHFLNSPQHAHAVVLQLAGEMIALRDCGEDDPLLYAYKLMDSLPSTFGQIVDLYKWAQSVTEATPDQIFESGAMLERRGA